MTGDSVGEGAGEALPGVLLPSFVQGRGEPAVFLPGLSFTHGVPTGPFRAVEAAMLGPLSRTLTLYWIGRRVDVPEGFTTAAFAADYARDLRRRFGRPMPVIGFSSGGFLGLQLALDHPDVVRRLVVVGADARITAGTRASNLRWIQHLRAGDVAAAWREMGTDMVAGPSPGTSASPGTRLQGVLASAAALLTAQDCTDGLRTAVSELDFDLTPDLGRIATPTLLVVGTADASTSPGALMRTQAALPDAQLLVVPRTGHVGSLLDRVAVRRISGFVRG